MSVRCTLVHNHPRLPFADSDRTLPYFHLWEMAGDPSGDLYLIIENSEIRIPREVWNRIIALGKREEDKGDD